MVITELTIGDFGVYQGEHTFNLRTSVNGDTISPIILIGGKNGAGKSTILESIRLCLYGQLALGNRVRKVDYDSYIRQRIHRPKSGGKLKIINSSRVRLEFEHIHAGVRSVYDAVRSWTIKGEQVVESVSVYKDGLPLKEIPSEFWGDFLRDLIPPGVSNLFFFDGEQIQALADPKRETDALQTAFMGLLNIGIINRLQDDLHIHIRQQQVDGSTQLQAEYNRVSLNYEDETSKLNGKSDDVAEMETVIEDMGNKVELLSQSLIQNGVQLAQKRAELEIKFNQLMVDRQNIRSSFHDLASGLMPFAFAPVWLQKVQDRMRNESEQERQTVIGSFKKDVSQRLSQQFLDVDFRREFDVLSDAQWSTLSDRFEGLFGDDGSDRLLSPKVHPVSEESRQKIYHLITQIKEEVPNQIDTLSTDLERCERERGDTASLIKKSPDDESSSSIITEFQTQSEMLGKHKNHLAKLFDEKRQIQNNLSEVERERSKLWNRMAETEQSDHSLERAAKAQLVLEKYRDQIIMMKIDTVSQLFVNYFNALCRKKNMVREIQIDPKNYRVTLYGEGRNEIPKLSLSAGERQLYAMSLLWALRSASGRQLPIIVDTPMGRLDSEHRQRIIDEFFPHAAHQIVLLSTDTEIDELAREKLGKSVARTYQLNFDQIKGETTISQSYFGEIQQDEKGETK